MNPLTDLSQPRNIFIACNPLVGEALAKETRELGFRVGSVIATGIETKGTLLDTYSLNLKLTTANRVLIELFRFRANKLEDLYKPVYGFEWENLLSNSELLSLHSVVRNDTIRDHRVVNLKVKDAIVDRMKKVYGKRPYSGSEFTGAVIFVLWKQDQCIIYLDTTGETLSKHGYRKLPHKAPLQEALASALIRSTRWDGKSPFVNPMCGSGTLAIEAALFATARKPGLLRNDYAFMHVRGYQKDRYRAMKAELQESVNVANPVIIATDRDARALKAARLNAKAAGVEDLIRFELCDFRATTLPEEAGIIIMNPEYGLRLGEVEQLEKTYAEIGDFLKQKCGGYTGYVFTGNLDLAKKIGLRTSKRIPFMNGKIDCRLLEYELYAGSKKNS